MWVLIPPKILKFSFRVILDTPHVEICFTLLCTAFHVTITSRACQEHSLSWEQIRVTGCCIADDYLFSFFFRTTIFTLITLQRQHKFNFTLPLHFCTS